MGPAPSSGPHIDRPDRLVLAMAHLLLVDDDSDVVEAFAEVLRAEGHKVRTARTGEEGLLALRAAPLPDLVVLDVDMPVLGGPGMAHQMLLHDAGEEKIPILLVSGSDNLPQIARRMGTPYFLRKPLRRRTVSGHSRSSTPRTLGTLLRVNASPPSASTQRI